MLDKRGLYDFSLEYSGCTEKAAVEFGRVLSGSYYISKMADNAFLAKLEKWGFFKFLFKHAYPHIQYVLECSGKKTRVNINLEIPSFLRILFHLNIILSFIVAHVCMYNIVPVKILFFFLSCSYGLYSVFVHLMIDRIVEKKIAKDLSDRFTVLWYQKSRKFVPGLEYAITAVMGIFSLAVYGTQSSFTGASVLKLFTFTIWIIPIIVWACFLAYNSDLRKASAKRYCCIVGAMVGSLFFILFLYSPSICGSSLFEVKASGYLVETWNDGLIEKVFADPDCSKLLMSLEKLVSYQLILISVLVPVFYLIGGFSLFSSRIFLEQFYGGSQSYHCQDMNHILAESISEAKKYDSSVMDGSKIDYFMIVYTFVVFCIFTWYGLIEHLEFWWHVFINPVYSDGNAVAFLARIIHICSVVDGNDEPITVLVIKIGIVSAFSMPIILALFMYCYVMVRNVWRNRRYKLIKPEKCFEFNEYVHELLCKNNIIFAIDRDSNDLSPYSRLTLFPFRKYIIFSDNAIKFFNRSPHHLTAIIAHEVGHFVKNHCWKIKVAQVLSRFGLVSSGMLSLLLNPLRLEDDADKYAKGILEENGLRTDMIKKAVEAIRFQKNKTLQQAAFSDTFQKGCRPAFLENKWDYFLLRDIYAYYKFQYDLEVYDYLHPPAKYR